MKKTGIEILGYCLDAPEPHLLSLRIRCGYRTPRTENYVIPWQAPFEKISKMLNNELLKKFSTAQHFVQ